MTKDEAIQKLTNRFLMWRLPDNFNPDGGISFTPDYNNGTEEGGRHRPVGTNLFDYGQAKQMIEYLLEDEDSFAAALSTGDE